MHGNNVLTVVANSVLTILFMGRIRQPMWGRERDRINNPRLDSCTVVCTYEHVLESINPDGGSDTHW